MKKNGLWEQPPMYLGYSGSHWNKKKGDTEDRDFEDLVIECFAEAIFSRKQSLLNQAATGKNIDGLVFQNIRWFLNEKRAEFDPIGKAIYENVNAATQKLVKKGDIEIRNQRKSWKEKFDNSALLAFRLSKLTTPSTKEEIVKALHKISEWNMAIYSSLRTENKKTREPLCKIFCQLKEFAIYCFEHGSLVNAVKKEVCIKEISISVPQNDDEDNESTSILNHPSLFTEDSIFDTNEIFQELHDFCEKLREEANKSIRRKDARKLLHQVLTERQEATLKEITESEIKIPSHEELARRLDNTSAGAVNDKIKKLRKLAKEVEKLNDWDPITLLIIEKMLK
jgi:hypothetical protein